MSGSKSWVTHLLHGTAALASSLLGWRWLNFLYVWQLAGSHQSLIQLQQSGGRLKLMKQELQTSSLGMADLS